MEDKQAYVNCGGSNIIPAHLSEEVKKKSNILAEIEIDLIKWAKG